MPADWTRFREWAAQALRRNRGVLIFMIGYKILFWLAVLILVQGSSYDAHLHEVLGKGGNFPWPRGDQISKWSHLATWDAGPYLSISRDGYQPDSPLCAYYPLFPALIAPFQALLGERAAFAMALAVNNALSILAGLLVYRIAARRFGGETAMRSVVLLFLSPGGVYFSLAYTESFFLFLGALIFYCIDTKRWNLAAAASFLLPLTRAVGVFILIPIVIHAWTARSWRLLFRLAVPAALGYGAYFLVMFLSVGSPWAGFAAQEDYLNSPSILQIFDLKRLVAAFPQVTDYCHPTAGLFDRVLFLAFVIGMALCVRLEKPLWMFCLAIGAVPALSNVFLSYTRFFAVCFPVFIGFASLCRSSGLNLYCLLLAALGAAAQFYCLARILAFKWVA